MVPTGTVTMEEMVITIQTIIEVAMTPVALLTMPTTMFPATWVTVPWAGIVMIGVVIAHGKSYVF